MSGGTFDGVLRFHGSQSLISWSISFVRGYVVITLVPSLSLFPKYIRTYLGQSVRAGKILATKFQINDKPPINTPRGGTCDAILAILPNTDKQGLLRRIYKYTVEIREQEPTTW